MKRTWLLALAALTLNASYSQAQSARSHSRRISTGEVLSAANARYVPIVGTIGGLATWNYDFFVEGSSPSNFSTYDYRLYYDTSTEPRGKGNRGSVDFLEQIGMGFAGAENLAFAFMSADMMAAALVETPEVESPDLVVGRSFGLSPYLTPTPSFGDGGMEGQASLQIAAAAIDSTVPEPSTYAMMLSGLFTLGLLARRQRKTRSAAEQ